MQPTNHRFSFICLMTMLAAAAASAPARPLQDRRWQDDAYGISLRAPIDCRFDMPTEEQQLAVIRDEQGAFRITVAVKQPNRDVPLAKLAESAVQQMALAVPATVLLDEVDRKIDDRPGRVLYFSVPMARGEDVFRGQALVRLDDRMYGVLEIQAHVNHREAARATFQTVLDSVELTDPEVLAKRRGELVERGHEWRKQLTAEDLHEVLIEERWYRLLENDRDIGYMRIRERLAEESQTPGIRIDVQSRTVRGAVTIDSTANYFLSDDDTQEFWSVTTTSRRPGEYGRGQQTSTVQETGIRTNARIELTVEGPAGREKSAYVRPLTGYLSQVEAWLLPRLLPVKRTSTAYGFYFLVSETQSVSFRHDTMRRSDGEIVVESKVLANRPAVVARYDKGRRLIEKRLTANRRLVPATETMVRQLWRNR